MKALMVLTSHDKLGDTGRKTGFWLEELAAPYYEFKEAGAQITLASSKGGRPPLDPKTSEHEWIEGGEIRDVFVAVHESGYGTEERLTGHGRWSACWGKADDLARAQDRRR